MNKRFLLTIFIILIAVFSTGCWNYREIDKLALVSGIAVDKINSNKGYEVTAEIIGISASTKEQKLNSTRIQSKGESIFECMRNMINISAKQLFWSHASILIVSEDVAKAGILPILDWIVRDSEPRLTLYLLVSETQNAREILSLQSLSTEIRSFEIEDMIISNSKLSKIPNIQVHELINDISTMGIYPVLPTVKRTLNEGKQTMTLSGGAILKRDKLAGYIGLEDVKYYLFVRNKFKGGLLTIDFPSNTPMNNVTLEVFRNKTKVTPMLNDGKLSMNIKIKTEVSIAEASAPIDPLKSSDIQRLKYIAEKSLEKSVLETINKIQDDFGLDIFGFGNIVKEKMPDLWKEINNDWDEIFKELKVNVDADIHIRGSGHLSKIFRLH